MRDIPKIIVALTLFVVILLTFVVTIKTLGQTRYFSPAPETVYLDIGSQQIKASISITKSVTPPVPGATNG